MTGIEKETRQDLITDAIKGLNTLMGVNRDGKSLDEKSEDHIKTGLRVLASLSKEDFDRILKLQKSE